MTAFVTGVPQDHPINLSSLCRKVSFPTLRRWLRYHRIERRTGWQTILDAVASKRERPRLGGWAISVANEPLALLWRAGVIDACLLDRSCDRASGPIETLARHPVPTPLTLHELFVGFVLGAFFTG